MPLLSVIIPCYNHGAYLRDAIASVEACPDRQACEIIIVNDGSTDAGTLAVLGQLETEGYHVLNQANQGLGAARNNGIRRSRGQYILPLDADNRIRPVYLTEGVRVLEQHPAVGVVYGHVQLFGSRHEMQQVPLFDLGALSRSNYIDACAVFRRSLWEGVGGYDENMPVMGYEDWDLWLAAATAGYGFYRLEEVAFEYQVRDDSMLRVNNTYDKLKRVYAYLFQKYPHLYGPGTLGEICVERAFLTYEVETLKAKLAAAREERNRVLADNRELGKRLLKNVFRPLLKRMGRR
ncbi:MAG TPA: glycosyltransferase family A protein [Cytophagales bacterium]